MSCAMLFLSRKAMQSQQKKRFVCKDLPQPFPPKNKAAYCREIGLSPLDCGGIDGDARVVGPAASAASARKPGWEISRSGEADRERADRPCYGSGLGGRMGK